ncbi:right-handed parallel beta-helix repeat-containing protein [Marinibacterium sp. SX1]|uniref:right-handed parallel beta-helix repeat-containing protein n=1 Tax=Marinibacterium sp. SX1 TaxID=3388424 RepID=UPI003D16B732
MTTLREITDFRMLTPVAGHPTKFTLPGAGQAKILRIAPGVHGDQLRIDGLRGHSGNEVIIEPLVPGWIDAARRPDPRADRYDHIFLQLKDCRHVILRNLCLANAWPTGLLMNKCRDITIENCRIRGGTDAIYAKATTGLTIRDCHWQQDTSPDHALWHRIDWVEAHGEEGGNNTYAHFNGSFLAGKGLGNVRVENNVISDAYNGIRTKHDPTASDALNNDNFVIAGNTFRRIRDNPIEPEHRARNWHIRHNRIIDAHGWLSFDGVRGGHIYIYGNIGRFETRQGQPGSLHHTMGRVLKLSYLSPNPDYASKALSPEMPWYVVNNSFFLRCPLIGGAAASVNHPDLFAIGPDVTTRLTFANNVFEWCGPQDYDDYTCAWIDLVRHFHKREDDGVVFDGSLTNRGDYLRDVHARHGWETGGIIQAAPLFRDGPGGDLRLAPDSAGLHSGLPLIIETPEGPAEVEPGDGGLNRGAWQDGYGLARLRLRDG